MNEMLIKTEMEQENNSVETKIFQRHFTTDIKFNFENLNRAVGKTYFSDYEFIKDYVIEYNGKSITEYCKLKKGKKENTAYYTARFPKRDWVEIMDRLDAMINYSTQKLTQKETRYKIKAINYDVVEMEKENAAFEARQSA